MDGLFIFYLSRLRGKEEGWGGGLRGYQEVSREGGQG